MTAKEAYLDAIDYVVKLQNVWAKHYQGERLKGMQAAARMIVSALEDKAAIAEMPEELLNMPEPEEQEDHGLPWDLPEETFSGMA